MLERRSFVVTINLKKMKQIYYMGVDISKEKVDIALIDNDHKLLINKIVKNDVNKLCAFLNALLRKLKIEKQDLLVCCEETGIYKRPLQMACIKAGIPLWVEIAIKIKRASTSLRGKSDKQDAIRIAEYACRYADKKVLYIEPDKENSALQTLLNTRESLIDEVTRMNQRMNESKRFDKAVYNIQKIYFNSLVKLIKKQVAAIEVEIDGLLNRNTEMSKTVELLSSIPGIGRQTSLQFIVYTRNFTLFQNAKHLACYAGVAPFQNESGTLIRKARVSQLANKKLKKLLHLAAMASVKAKGDIKEYYIRKVQEGKNKMLVLNNVRNKLVSRMFAVINRQSKYVSINFETNICLLT